MFENMKLLNYKVVIIESSFKPEIVNHKIEKALDQFKMESDPRTNGFILSPVYYYEVGRIIGDLLEIKYFCYLDK
ncbi:hypothetical protein QA612_09795 [Evansella sp. AB-P1]|uniref:hypothetical protein n=1 Tax=Evansella sp. AB-P1 TaxID=3037653 RepID=UPI00241E1935|nr:hypothetical protein [Evansella sp. AB-P1]MDG5787792.1 hypothetical protein [Evansella sp. AB-P1]